MTAPNDTTPLHTYRITGRPTPKGSRRTARTKTGQTVNFESNPRVRGWMSSAVEQLAEQTTRAPLDGPYHVLVVFTYKRPKRPTYEHPSQGDIDKLVRALLDVLGPGSKRPNGKRYAGIITDDAHVISVDATKMWGDRDETTVVVIERAR